MGVQNPEAGQVDRHRAMQIRLGRCLASADSRSAIIAPVIHALIVPLLFLDLSITIYRMTRFRASGIARVRRRDREDFRRRLREAAGS